MSAHCPDCLRDDIIELPPLSIHDLTADFECQHCGCIFELGFSSHSPDDDYDYDYDFVEFPNPRGDYPDQPDKWRESGNPDLPSVSGNRP